MTDASNAGHGPNPFPRDPMPRAVIENEQIFNAFHNSVTHQVNQRIDEKLARTRATSIAVVATLITLITASGSFIFNRVLLGEVEDQVRLQLDAEARHEFRQTELLGRNVILELQLRAMDEAVGVSNDELALVIEEFEFLYSELTSLSSSRQAESKIDFSISQTTSLQTARGPESQLSGSFHLLIKILSAIDHTEKVEQLAELAPGLAQKSDVAFQALTQSYGRQIIGAAGAPKTWQSGEPFHDTFQRYREWSSRARANGFPELYVLFESLIWHMEGRSSAEISELIADINELNPNDGHSYEFVLLSLANEAFTTEPDASSARIKERTRSFITAYADTSPRIQRVAQQMSP